MFEEFKKIPRLSRLMTITEKIDGTNAQIYITEDGDIKAGSRSRFITPTDDNHGFARWVEGNKSELLKLGPGRHFGEWWGQGIQRGYGLKEKRFSLFNAERWTELRPAICHIVPILAVGMFDTDIVEDVIEDLTLEGSKAAPGFMKPEGIIIYHKAANTLFKKTLEKDHEYKGVNNG